MTVALKLAIPCGKCGKLLAEWDGREAVLRRPPHVPFVMFQLPATIQCWRGTKINGRWRECAHVTTIDQLTIERLTMLT